MQNFPVIKLRQYWCHFEQMEAGLAKLASQTFLQPNYELESRVWSLGRIVSWKTQLRDCRQASYEIVAKQDLSMKGDK